MNLGALGIAHGIVQDLLLWLVPIGTGHDWWGDESDIPRGYIIAAAQDIEASKYPRLYKLWFKNGVHKYGAGSTSTSTKAPDKRGRSSVGKDDMGGTAANRITTGGSGVDGTTLGANGGAEIVTLSAAQVPALSHRHRGHQSVQLATGSFTRVVSNTWQSQVNGSGGVTDLGYSDVDFNGQTHIENTSLGSGTSHQNTHPIIVCNHIIRAG